ncbi:MAG: UvrD-helicase domain-containing protein [Bacilli bacterium]|nr:UvrD-helicase domain-containing protein [Bacilli bacterium]MDD4733656.1 UvrD-helicase domain-containing protein [Bacilli bacterium]
MNLEELNDSQKEAIKQTEGPLLILAGAGSGKTKVLTMKVAYLISEKNIDPASILAITFTNKASKEMKDRIVKLLGKVAYEIKISTFHSFGLTIIKDNYSYLGLKKNFTILDSDDTLTLIKKIVKEMELNPKLYDPKAIRNRISGAKNELLDSNKYETYANTDYEKVVLEVYRSYEQRLKKSSSLDFDDLLMLPIKLFNENPKILKQYQEKYKYILIDEYQDTNEAQYLLTKMISAKYKNICVVGDPDQSIYSFRGSNYKNILNFERDYKNAKTIKLEKNYRSTKTILDVANDIIKNNNFRKDKDLWTDNKEGEKIKYHRCENEKDEGYYIVNEIKKLNSPLSEIAVLYRTNAQSRNIEDALLRERIPYKVVGSFYFYKRKEIKDLIAYLKMLYNEDDDASLLRVINVPKRGIGTKTIENLSIKSISNNESIYNSINGGKELEFKKIIEELKLIKENVSLTDLIDLILDKTGIREEYLNKGNVESEIRLENLEEFKSITRNFEEENGTNSLEEFLYTISLVSDAEEYKNNNDTVTLMTVHSAKGLEFDNVFIVGLEETIFPHANSLDDVQQLEEERRLCYVAVTRAKKRLWLTNAKQRMLFGMNKENQESRFLSEIDKSKLETENVINVFNKESMIDDNVEYKIGEKIIHDNYGKGIIVDINNTLVSIAFPHPIGIKKFMRGHKSIKKV